MHASRTLDLVPLVTFLNLPYPCANIYSLFISQTEARIIHVALFVWTKLRDNPIIDLLEKACDYIELNQFTSGIALNLINSK